ncbi:flavin-containing monooxygenase [Aspergillus lucknowensis]|uniref:FAD/NAD(P)-binding domain-containing protein n=1 Tax=Aspergillus lucknowensis TaxID=176173 RepID=A0ABR4LTF3_9EURO
MTLSSNQAGPVNVAVGKFPATSPSNLSIGEADTIAQGVVDRFNKALAKGGFDTVAALFYGDGYWRDHLCLSWDLKTLKGHTEITTFLESHKARLEVDIDRSSAFRQPTACTLDGLGNSHGIQFFTNITLDFGKGRGIVRLAEENGQWKILTFFTSLVELKGHEEPLHGRRSKRVEHGGQPDRKNWRERREEDAEFSEKEPAVLIIGAGQGGLTAAARLKMLNVDTLIIDQNDRIGDNWRQRYRQLVLHDPVWYDHMPYVSFPPHWPVFTPKDKLAEWFEAYAKILELNVWTRTTLKTPTWDGKKWTVVLERRNPDDTVSMRTVHPRHIVQATGHSGEKYVPPLAGLDTFKGDRICHSSDFRGALHANKGKKAIVVGSCNSGHDIAQDFFEKGYDVTMVQRSTTCVISSEAITDIGLAGLYDENGPPTEDADLWFWGLPVELLKVQQIGVTALQNEHDKATLEGLDRAGFKVDKGPNDAGLLLKYFQRGGGYYIDVGASQLIVDGKIKIKQGVEIDQVLPHGLRFADGSELEADEIILATGYQNMRTQTRRLFGAETADAVGDVWGFDANGEMRGIWRPSGHPGLWFMGGNLAISRYYSKILGLQIKAAEVGLSS